MNNAENDYLSAEQVAEYLLNNRDFFDAYKDLLFELKIPHESGRAISLVEKQVSVMRERNTDLRRRLSQLIQNARENDRLFEHTRRLVLAMLDCRSLDQLLDTVQQSFESSFKVQFTSIILFDASPTSKARSVTLNEAQHFLGRHLKSRQTVGGGLDSDERKFLFGRDAIQVGSAALAVLTHGDLFGVLAVGNRDVNYYRSSMGTLFLSYIGEVLARMLHRIKLENHGRL